MGAAASYDVSENVNRGTDRPNTPAYTPSPSGGEIYGITNFSFRQNGGSMLDGGETGAFRSNSSELVSTNQEPKEVDTLGRGTVGSVLDTGETGAFLCQETGFVCSTEEYGQTPVTSDSKVLLDTNNRNTESHASPPDLDRRGFHERSSDDDGANCIRVGKEGSSRYGDVGGGGNGGDLEVSCDVSGDKGSSGNDSGNSFGSCDSRANPAHDEVDEISGFGHIVSVPGGHGGNYEGHTDPHDVHTTKVKQASQGQANVEVGDNRNNSYIARVYSKGGTKVTGGTRANGSGGVSASSSPVRFPPTTLGGVESRNSTPPSGVGGNQPNSSRAQVKQRKQRSKRGQIAGIPDTKPKDSKFDNPYVHPEHPNQQKSKGMNVPYIMIVMPILLDLFSIAAFAVDMGSDIWLAVDYFRDGDTIWGSFTISFVALSCLISIFAWPEVFTDFHQNISNCGKCVAYFIFIFFFIIVGPFLNIYITIILFTRHLRRLKISDDQKDEPFRTRSDIIRGHMVQRNRLRLYECILESTPQLCLQIYIYIKDPDTDAFRVFLQWTSMVTSLLSISLAGPLYDRAWFIRSLGRDLPWRNTILHVISTVLTVGARIVTIGMVLSLNPYYSLILATPNIFFMIGWHYHYDLRWMGIRSWLIVAEWWFSMMSGVYMHHYSLSKLEGKQDKHYRSHFWLHHVLLLLSNACMITVWFTNTDMIYLDSLIILVGVRCSATLGFIVDAASMYWCREETYSNWRTRVMEAENEEDTGLNPGLPPQPLSPLPPLPYLTHSVRIFFDIQDGAGVSEEDLVNRICEPSDKDNGVRFKFDTQLSHHEKICQFE